MATVDKEINVRLSIQPDDAAQAKVDASINRVEDSLKRLTVAQGGVATSGDQAVSELDAVWKEYTDTVLQAKDATDELTDSTERAGQSASGIGGVTGLRRTGGALTQLGLGEIGRPVSQIGDIAQVVKEIGQITEATKPLVDSLASVGGGIAPLTVAFTGLGGSIGVVLAAALPVGIALAGVAIAFSAFQKTLEDGKKAIDAAIDSQKSYYIAVQSGTKDSIEKQIKDLEDGKTVTDKLASDVRNALVKTLSDAADTGNFVEEAKAALAAAPLKDQLDKLTEASNNAQQAIDKLKQALVDKEFTDAVLKSAQARRDDVKLAQEDAALTTDAVKKKIKASQDLLAQDEAELDELLKSGDTSKQTQDRIKTLQDDMSNLNGEIFKLQNVTLVATEAQDKYNKSIEDHQKSLDDANKAAVEATKAEEAKNKSLADATKKYDDDVIKINEQGIQDRIAIEKKYQDTLVSIAEKAAQQSADDLRKLKDQEKQDLVNFNRGEQDANARARLDDLKTQIKSQEEEQKALVDHQRKLEDIRQSARNKEADFILNRNFLGLFQNQLATRQAMEDENTAFGRSEQDRSVARQQQARDASLQREFDHQQRIQAYERANQDAKRNYDIQVRDQQIANQRARVAALQGEQQQLVDLQKKIQTELTLRRQGIVAELQLISMGDAQRLALEKKYLTQAQQLISGASGGMNQPIQRGTQINYTQHISTPNADPRQVAAIANSTFIQNLRRVTGAGQ